jgi:hypothetical protein
MTHYEVLCDHVGCTRPAHFKIASQWSDGSTKELKTYALSCTSCVRVLFESANGRHGKCRLEPHETLDRPEVYEWVRGMRDRQLIRRTDLEAVASPNEPIASKQ